MSLFICMVGQQKQQQMWATTAIRVVSDMTKNKKEGI
jgi:hypothetical protein